MNPFIYSQQAATMAFAPGLLGAVGDTVASLDIERAMLIHSGVTSEAADEIEFQLDERLAARWGEVAQHVPVELAERARVAARDADIDGIICIGGGSTIGLAKAIALTEEVPIVAVPTTYAGSEQTAIYGLTGGRHKQTGTDPTVQPEMVIYDPMLTLSLPPSITGPSAFNALAHSIEALWAPEVNPITTAIALEGIRCINRSLPAVMASPTDIDARGTLQIGAALSGIALGTTSAGLHHKICHVLGGRFGLVHADAHSVVLPHVVAYNAPFVREAMEELGAALDVPDGHEAAGLWDLAVASQVPTKLSSLEGSGGPLQRDDLAAVAETVAAETRHNPRPVDQASILELLERAFDGQRPDVEDLNYDD